MDRLLHAVEAAGLSHILTEPGTDFTLLAPSDEAFAQLDPAVAHYLLQLNQTALRDVLLYHMIPHQQIILNDDDDVVLPLTVETALGLNVSLDRRDGDGNNNNDDTVSVNDDQGAVIVTPDIITLNGVVHVIDHVLIPPTVTVPSTTLADILTTRDDLTALAAAALSSALVKALKEGYYTVFAPHNESLMDAWQDLSDDELSETVRFHVVRGYYSAQTLKAIAPVGLHTLSGDYLKVEFDGDDLLIDGVAMVIEEDVTALNGVLHVIDAPLTPPVHCPYKSALKCWWEGYH